MHFYKTLLLYTRQETLFSLTSNLRILQKQKREDGGKPNNINILIIICSVHSIKLSFNLHLKESGCSFLIPCDSKNKVIMVHVIFKQTGATSFSMKEETGFHLHFVSTTVVIVLQQCDR